MCIYVEDIIFEKDKAFNLRSPTASTEHNNHRHVDFDSESRQQRQQDDTNSKLPFAHIRFWGERSDGIYLIPLKLCSGDHHGNNNGGNNNNQHQKTAALQTLIHSQINAFSSTPIPPSAIGTSALYPIKCANKQLQSYFVDMGALSLDVYCISSSPDSPNPKLCLLGKCYVPIAKKEES